LIIKSYHLWLLLLLLLLLLIMKVHFFNEELMNFMVEVFCILNHLIE